MDGLGNIDYVRGWYVWTLHGFSGMEMLKMSEF